MGRGMPISHSKAPFPKLISLSCVVHADNARPSSSSGGGKNSIQADLGMTLDIELQYFSAFFGVPTLFSSGPQFLRPLFSWQLLPSALPQTVSFVLVTVASTPSPRRAFVTRGPMLQADCRCFVLRRRHAPPPLQSQRPQPPRAQHRLQTSPHRPPRSTYFSWPWTFLREVAAPGVIIN